MENELFFALKLLGLSLEELRTKMILNNSDGSSHSNSNSDDECILSTKYKTIYTDGACPDNGSGNRASIGVFFGDNDSRNISSKILIANPTNNRAELFAILMALENSVGPVEICSDSQYAIACVTKWIKNWKKNNWKTSTGKPVKNKEIIIQIDEKMKNRLVSFRHVSNFDHKKPTNKTNRDHWGNYMADKLANEALTN